jgi:hypothetical protein
MNMHEWDRCAVKGCPLRRVLNSQGCRLHSRSLIHQTCDDIIALPDVQEHRGPNRNRRTAEEISRRAAVHHGTTPEQIVAWLRAEEARVQSEVSEDEVRS